jgi:hypothetical protein
MLATNLTTNEVKNAAGTEVEFLRIESSGRKVVFAQSGEAPALPHRLTISHSESGVGIKAVRRSVIRFDKTSLSDTDSETPITNTAYIVTSSPVGLMADYDELKAVLAELTSFVSTLGNNTFLYDGTGTGAAALLAGTT